MQSAQISLQTLWLIVSYICLPNFEGAQQVTPPNIRKESFKLIDASNTKGVQASTNIQNSGSIVVSIKSATSFHFCKDCRIFHEGEWERKAIINTNDGNNIDYAEAVELTIIGLVDHNLAFGCNMAFGLNLAIGLILAFGLNLAIAHNQAFGLTMAIGLIMAFGLNSAFGLIMTFGLILAFCRNLALGLITAFGVTMAFGLFMAFGHNLAFDLITAFGYNLAFGLTMAFGLIMAFGLFSLQLWPWPHQPCQAYQ